MSVEVEIQKRVAEHLGSDKFEAVMQESIEKAVNGAIQSMFSYGALSDQIKEAFKEKLSVDVARIDFAHINQIISDMVKEKTVAAFQAPLRDKLAENLSEMFAPAQKEITVQGIIDLLREEHRDECCADPEKEFTLEIQKNDYGWHLKIWDEDGKTTKGYSSSIENNPVVDFYVSDKKDKRIAIIYNMMQKRLGTDLFQFDAKIFMMYCAGTKITDIDTADPDDLNLRINDHIDY